MMALSHLRDVEIVALADLDTARAEQTQGQANARRKADSPPIQAKIFADYRRMLDEAAPDCTYLVLPPMSTANWTMTSSTTASLCSSRSRWRWI